MLPSGNETPTGSSKLEIQVSRRFDFALLVGSFVHVSSLPPQALNHVGHRFSNRRNFRLGCVEVGGVALKTMECQRKPQTGNSGVAKICFCIMGLQFPSCLICPPQTLNMSDISFRIGGTFVWVVWRWKGLASRKWMANWKRCI